MPSIKITGARANNLKGVDVDIPMGKFVVVTGISGSGKSSLVFDIIFEHGRKQYLESIGMLSGIQDEDLFNSIIGIRPTVAVKQSLIRQSNPRSVVGTKTRILSMLSILFSVEGQTDCPLCGEKIGRIRRCICGHIEEAIPTSCFSFNSPQGLCLECHGRGYIPDINRDRIDARLTLPQIWAQQEHTYGDLDKGFEQLAELLQFDLQTPYFDLPSSVQQAFFYGVHPRPRKFRFGGFLYFLLDRIRNGKAVPNIIVNKICSVCQGDRIGEEGRSVLIDGMNIGQLCRLSVSELHTFLSQHRQEGDLSPFGVKCLMGVIRKISHMAHVGLGHLTLYREMPTLSGGELQRLFLMSHLDSEMESLIYIFDEPTAGLHEKEKIQLLKSIQMLKEQGNSIIVVEHDINTMEQADYIIDIGPGAGIHGGEVTYQGDYKGILQAEGSITGQYLSGKKYLPVKKSCAVIGAATPGLKIAHADKHNLKNITVNIPLSGIIGIAGVSGSGKSSLVSDTLVPLLKTHFETSKSRTMIGNVMDQERDPDVNDSMLMRQPGQSTITGLEHIKGYAEVTQAPIGRHRNSNPATYIGIWDKIRKVFAQQPEAQARGYGPGHFSYNSVGVCPECRGEGVKLNWFGNLYFSNTCPECRGTRYLPEVVEIKYQDKHIADVLAMSVSEACTFFKRHQPIYQMLDVVEQTGLGYISLGQPASTLSGGESQRIKLAKQLARRRREKGTILYILDEPTTGLSFYDVDKLLVLIEQLKAQGHVILLTEHDPHMLSYCDWIIELGPGGGNEGGHLIAQGPPHDLKQNPDSIIGQYLMV